MNPPVWLAEFHRQWQAARGGRLRQAARPFSRRWEDLLDDAGLRSAAERSHALREAEAFQAQGFLILRFHHYRRYLAESVAVPVAAEPWLIGLFGGISAEDRRLRAVALVQAFRAANHPRWPDSWRQTCDRLIAAFERGQSDPPFSWKEPEELEFVLSLLRDLTAREWPEGTLIRDASTAIGRDSKCLERRRRVLESALAKMFGEETPIESLGLACSQSQVTLHGPLHLHFDDGTEQSLQQLHGEFSVSLSDLQRCTHAMTPAGRILTIENSKTPFRQAVAANGLGEALIIATSYPNSATKRLLEILPQELPHFHFGDTDVSGYAILRSLRGIAVRPVGKFLMDWQDKENSPPLSEHDRRVLPSLKASPLMTDCLPCLTRMEDAGRKGCFEQESRGAPRLRKWPFWSEAVVG